MKGNQTIWNKFNLQVTFITLENKRKGKRQITAFISLWNLSKRSSLKKERKKDSLWKLKEGKKKKHLNTYK